MDAKGNQMIGAPNLTDSTWLYGGNPKTITKTITGGRKGVMPAHKDLLGGDKIHLLAAYVYGLSHN
jgi:cytochrome c oxidase cbb3-type subunit 3